MHSEHPTWSIEGEGNNRWIKLAGAWALFIYTRDKQRLAREFRHLESPHSLGWDLNGIDKLDSAGALFLWRLWEHQLPRELECRTEYRRWFERFDALPETPPEPNRNLVWVFLQSLGGGLTAFFNTTIGLFKLLGLVFLDIVYCFLNPRVTPWREISASIYRNGVSSLVLVGVTGFVIGVVMTLQLGMTLKQFGANGKIIGLLGLAILRELGPVIAALIQAGRAGSSMTAGIAGMHLTEELDALRTFGGSPTLRLVLPKVVSMTLVMPLLVVWCDFNEILGGMMTSQMYLGIPHGLFLVRFPNSVSLFNFWLGLGKGAVFGITISVVASYFGLNARASTDSLSAQTTNAVVVGLTLILIMDATSGALLSWMGILG